MGAVRERVEQPPLHVVIEFWFLGKRVDKRWLPWAERELSSPHYGLRRAAAAVSWVCAINVVAFVVQAIAGEPNTSLLWVMLCAPAGAMVAGLIWGERARRLDLLRQRGEIEDWFGITLREFVLWGAGGIAGALILIVLVFALT